MAVPVVQSQSADTVVTTNGSTITITKPSGVVSGDLMLVFISTDGATTSHTSSGWTTVEEETTSTGAKCTLAIMSKIAGGSEPSDYTFTGGGNQTRCGIIFRIDGQNATFKDVSGIDNTGDSATPTAPDVTTTVDDCLVLCAYAQDEAEAPNIHPGSTTELADFDSAGGDPASTLGVASYTQASAGATGTKQWTDSNSNRWIGAQVAIAPAAGGLSLVKFGNDTEQVTEVSQASLGLLRFGPDTEQIDEASQASLGLLRFGNDTEQIDEATGRPLGLLRFGNDTEQVDETTLRPRDMSRFGPDTEQIDEATLRPRDMSRSGDDVEQIDEATSRPQDMTRLADDTEEIADVDQASLGLLRFGDDTVEISDGVLSILGIVRIANDTLNIAEAVQHQLGLLRFGDDTVEVTEATARAMTLVRLIGETIELPEGVIRTMALTRLVGETVEVAEGLIRVMDLVRFTPDTVELADAIESVLGLVRVIDETEELADGVVEHLVAATPGFEFANDTVNIAEAATPARVMIRVPAGDTEEIAEATIAQIGIPQTLSATVNVSELVVEVCKPVASFGVLKVYDGTAWREGPEFFAP